MAANVTSQKPSKTYDAQWIHVFGPDSCRNKGETLGKWLVFKPVPEIDETWETIRELVKSGELGATAAKVSTMMENSTARKGDRSKVICVYTTKEDVDEVGLKLIKVIKETIRYKTDEATLAGEYSWSRKGKVTCRTLMWNDGNPRFAD